MTKKNWNISNYGALFPENFIKKQHSGSLKIHEFPYYLLLSLLNMELLLLLISIQLPHKQFVKCLRQHHCGTTLYINQKIFRSTIKILSQKRINVVYYRVELLLPSIQGFNFSQTQNVLDISISHYTTKDIFIFDAIGVAEMETDFHGSEQPWYCWKNKCFYLCNGQSQKYLSFHTQKRGTKKNFRQFWISSATTSQHMQC